MKISCLFTTTVFIYCIAIVLCAEKDSSISSTSAGTNSNTRQGTTALTVSSVISTLASFLPRSLTNFFPALLLFGLSAMLVPAFGLGMLLREGRRSDYNVQPNNLAASLNPLFAKNLQLPIAYKEFEAINRGFPYIKNQPQFQTRSMPSFDFNNVVLDVLNKIQKSLDNINLDNSKKAPIKPTTEKR